MARIPVPLGPHSDKAKQRQGGGATLVNCYVESTEDGKTSYSINTDPGLVLFSTALSGGAGRGLVALGNSLYAVVGETLRKISSNGTPTTIGIVLGQKPVIFSINRKSPNAQITITADTKNYYVEADVITEITDPDLPAGVHSNAYLNGRTIYGINDGRAFVSATNSTASISALAFSEAERDNDNGTRVFAFGEEWWYFGERSLEIFRNDPTDIDFPFSPLQGAGRGKGAGCIAKSSPAIVAGLPTWVSDEKMVVRGYDAERISTHEIERDIEATAKAGALDSITGYALELEGHQFYILRALTWCHVFDATTGLWHLKTDYLGTTWRGGFYVYAFNKHLILDATDGLIYEYTFDAADENGAPLIPKIITNPLNAFPDGYICDAFHLDVQSGVGRAAQAAHVQDPQVLLRVSRDGGMTYGNEYARSAGAQGKWKKQLRYNRLGATNGAGMVFEIRMPEPVDRAVLQAAADVRKLAG